MGSAESWNGFSEQLRGLKEANLFRRRLSHSSPQGPRIKIDGRELLNFCSNDYLGLANDNRIIRSFQQAAADFGVGSGASPLVCGRSTAHVELEELVAMLTGRDRALLFSSGYLANLALVSTFCGGRSDMVFEDRLNHASLIDAAVLSRARLQRYPHLDTEALEKKLLRASEKRKLILTDTLFSMDGDLAPLRELAVISDKFNALLAVDDAHGFGIYGNDGAGLLNEYQLGQERVPLMVATFGKALGCAGAFVAGPDELIEYMVQKSRPYIYSTSLAPALAVAATTALELLRQEPERREHLHAMIDRFRRGAMQAGLPLKESGSAIQPLLMGSAASAMAASEALLRAGILVTAIRPPTVPANTSRLRITLSASHCEEDVDILLDRLSCCCRKGEAGGSD